MVQDRLVQLRDLLAGPADEVTWELLTLLLSEAPEPEQAELDYLEAHLAGWPDALRRVPMGWLRRLLEGGEVRAMAICRNLMLGPLDVQVGPWDPLPPDKARRALERLAAQEALGAIRALDLRGATEAPTALIVSPHLAELHTLWLGRWLYRALVPALVDAPWGRSLRHLHITPAVIQAITAADWHVLLDAPLMARLKTLELLRCETFSAEHLRRALITGQLRGLEWLGLGFCGVRGSDLRLLASAGLYLKGLELPLGGPDPDTLRALVNAPTFALEHLNLDYCALDDTSVQQIAEGVATRNLRSLDLSNNALSAAGLQALLRAPCAATLEVLKLNRIRLADEALRLLAGAELPELRELHISHASVSSIGLAALAEAPGLPRLQRLTLWGAQPGPAREALRRRYPYIVGLHSG